MTVDRKWEETVWEGGRVGGREGREVVGRKTVTCSREMEHKSILSVLRFILTGGTQNAV